MPAVGVGRVVQVVSALPLTPRRAFPVGGEGRGDGGSGACGHQGHKFWGGSACICEGGRQMRVRLQNRASRGMVGDGVVGEADERGGDGGS